eukprot:CCRYP_002839-RD/>CCRYP_002839-RD protein AED:0.54 eAED:0.43 QI:0/-1/0/1/-1/0/1/0/189
MKLAIHGDASYLSEPKARSRAGGHFFLSFDETIPHNNGAILNIPHIIKNVMSSAIEAELAALYIMAREAVCIRIILEEMGHKQIQPKRAKAMDMRFHWLHDCDCSNQFKFYWCRVKTNMPIIGPNTTPPLTTSTFGQNFSHLSLSSKCFSKSTTLRLLLLWLHNAHHLHLQGCDDTTIPTEYVQYSPIT